LFKMSNKAVASICVLVVVLLRQSGSYLPEPRESHFFLKRNYQHQSRLASVFFTEPSNTEERMLCLGTEEYHGTEVEMLAHLICTQTGFQSFSSVSKSEAQMVERSDQVSGLSCSLSSSHQIQCIRPPVKRLSVVLWAGCHSVQVVCGPCHQQRVTGPERSLTFWSPMYPVLVPGLVCRYDVSVEASQSQQVEVRLLVTDLSLPSPEGGDSETSDCGDNATSSIHVLTAGAGQPLQSALRLCGNSNQRQIEFNFHNMRKIELRFSSGGEGYDDGVEVRGFQLTVSVSAVKKSNHLDGVIISFLSVFFLLALLICFLCCMLGFSVSKSAPSRLRRRRVPGQMIENIYMIDWSVRRRSEETLQDQESKLSSKSVSDSSNDEQDDNLNRVLVPPPTPPPLPYTPGSVLENSEESPIYLSIAGEDNQVFEENRDH